MMKHGLRTPREEIAFTARPKIHSHSQIFRYGGSIFCLPHRPNFSDIFDLCLHWVSVVRDWRQQARQQNNALTYEGALGRKAHPKKKKTFVLSKEQTLVDLFRNNSLACMGDFKRAICIFLFMHAPFFSFSFCFGITCSALIFGIFSTTTHYKIIFFFR